MEERIGLCKESSQERRVIHVLILIVMEERIGLSAETNIDALIIRLNPYCNGRKNRI